MTIEVKYPYTKSFLAIIHVYMPKMVSMDAISNALSRNIAYNPKNKQYLIFRPSVPSIDFKASDNLENGIPSRYVCIDIKKKVPMSFQYWFISE